MTPNEESVLLLEQDVDEMGARAAQAAGPEELALCAHIYMQQKAALHEGRMRQGLNASGPEALPFVGDETFWSDKYRRGEGGRLKLRESARRVSPTLWQLRAVRMQKAYPWVLSAFDTDSSTSADTEPSTAGRNPFVYAPRASMLTMPGSRSRASSPETVVSTEESLQRRSGEAAVGQGSESGSRRQATQRLQDLHGRSVSPQRPIGDERHPPRTYRPDSSHSTFKQSSCRPPDSPNPTTVDDNPETSDSPGNRARRLFGLDGAADSVNIEEPFESESESESDSGQRCSSAARKEESNTPPTPRKLLRRINNTRFDFASRQKHLTPDNHDADQRIATIRGQGRRAHTWDDFEVNMPSNTGLARQPPGSAMGTQQQGPMSVQPPAQQQVNGIGPGLTNGLAHAGHQTDINYLWGVVQELSDALARNREQSTAIVARVQNMNGANGAGTDHHADADLGQVNGDSDHQNNTSAENASLRSQLHQSQSTLADTQAEASSLASINDDYVTFLHGTMDKIRSYAYAHSNAMVATHAHYNQLLEQEREANMQLRIEHGEWQRGLGRAAELARNALKERSDEVSGLERKMRETRAENLVLRRLLGWEAVEEDDSEDEDSSELHARQRMAAGAGQGSNLT